MAGPLANIPQGALGNVVSAILQKQFQEETSVTAAEAATIALFRDAVGKFQKALPVFQGHAEHIATRISTATGNKSSLAEKRAKRHAALEERFKALEEGVSRLSVSTVMTEAALAKLTREKVVMETAITVLKDHLAEIKPFLECLEAGNPWVVKNGDTTFTYTVTGLPKQKK